MTIEMKEGRYFKGMMNFEFRKGSALPGFPTPNSDGNLLAAVYTDNKQTWHLVFRFRYYVDDLIHDSNDKRSWFRATMDNPKEEEVWKSVFEALSLMAIASESKLNYVLIESDKVEVQMEKIQELPGMSSKRVDEN